MCKIPGMKARGELYMLDVHGSDRKAARFDSERYKKEDFKFHKLRQCKMSDVGVEVLSCHSLP
jgi:hypothetical protein